jgi:hypothetical protein
MVGIEPLAGLERGRRRQTNSIVVISDPAPDPVQPPPRRKSS